MESETALTTPTTAFVTDWTRLACRLSPAIQSIRRPARWTVITFRFMPDYDDLHFAELSAFYEGISQLRSRNEKCCTGTVSSGAIHSPLAIDISSHTISNPACAAIAPRSDLLKT